MYMVIKASLTAIAPRCHPCSTPVNRAGYSGLLSPECYRSKLLLFSQFADEIALTLSEHLRTFLSYEARSLSFFVSALRKSVIQPLASTILNLHSLTSIRWLN